MSIRKNKYGVSPKNERTVDGIVFASKKEAKRWGELRLLETAGHIAFLERQPRFDIAVRCVHICFYKADFRYTNPDGSVTIEDVKGFPTPLYRLKKKLVEALYGIKIIEV